MTTGGTPQHGDIVGRAAPDGRTQLAWLWESSLERIERTWDLTDPALVMVADYRRRSLDDLLAGDAVRVRGTDLVQAGLDRPPPAPHGLADDDLCWWLLPDGRVAEIAATDPILSQEAGRG